MTWQMSMAFTKWKPLVPRRLSVSPLCFCWGRGVVEGVVEASSFTLEMKVENCLFVLFVFLEGEGNGK